MRGVLLFFGFAGCCLGALAVGPTVLGGTLVVVALLMIGLVPMSRDDHCHFYL